MLIKWCELHSHPRYDLKAEPSMSTFSRKHKSVLENASSGVSKSMASSQQGTKSKVDRGLHSCTCIFSLYFPSMATIILKCGLLRGYITTLCCFKTLLFAWSRWSLMKQLAFSQISPVCLFLSEPANPSPMFFPDTQTTSLLGPRHGICQDRHKQHLCKFISW